MAVVYGNKDHFGTQAVLAAAEYGGQKLTLKDEQVPSSLFFISIRPSLVHNGKVLVDTNPVSWFLSNGKLRGQNKEEENDVICWLNAAATLYRPAVLSWVLPATSNMPYDKKTFEAAKGDAEFLLEKLNDTLLKKTYLVGERLSLADLVMAFTVKPAYEHVLEAGATSIKYQNLTRWFLTIMNQPEVMKVAEVKLCEVAEHFDEKLFKQNQSKQCTKDAHKEHAHKDHGHKDHGHKDAHKSDAGKKDEKVKKDKKKAAKEDEEEEEMDACEAALAGEEQKKDPFLDFEKGTFNMDEFKRVYSNEDTATKAIPYFWDKFDKANYSIWHGVYKYPEDLTLVFMSCNLITGMFQRLDKMRKHAFGSVCLFGENNASQIEGIWFWRSQELAFELSSDWKVDYESYQWTKLNPDDEKTKKMVNEFLLWEGDFDGKKFNQGKIFK